MRHDLVLRKHACALLFCAGLILCSAAGFAQAPQGGQQIPKARVVERVKSFDANGDGKITRAEFTGPAFIFTQIDKNGDGTITADELTEFAKDGGTITVGPGGAKKGAQKQGAAKKGAAKQDPSVKRERIGSIPATVKPLSEMTAEDRYKGQDGGLYGKGQNTPPEAHLKAALQAAGEIKPLDKDGKPAPDGKIGFISFGMSNTTMEFQTFQKMLEPLKLNPALAVVDCAQGGMITSAWAKEMKNPRTGGTPWEELARRLQAAGVSPAQVQVVWMKQAEARPAGDGEFPAHIQKFQENMVTGLQKLKARYPNIRLVYLSSRIYAGYALTELNPEPYAYEYAYGLRGLIQDQIAGKAELNCDPARGAVKAPLLLWGPYLWANGTAARKDGFKWENTDLGADGTHPDETGRVKVAKLLLQFLQTDPTAKLWFVGK